MHQKYALFENLQRCIKGAQLLGIPILWIEQYPQGLGSTIDEISQLMPGQQPLPKTTFSCYVNKDIRQALEALERRQLLVAGIEAHVCVYQSVVDLIGANYHVEVISDAVSAREKSNLQLGLQRMQTAGANLTSTEMCLFELLATNKGEAFKQILKLVK